MPFASGILLYLCVLLSVQRAVAVLVVFAVALSDLVAGLFVKQHHCLAQQTAVLMTAVRIALLTAVLIQSLHLLQLTLSLFARLAAAPAHPGAHQLGGAAAMAGASRGEADQ